MMARRMWAPGPMYTLSRMMESCTSLPASRKTLRPSTESFAKPPRLVEHELGRRVVEVGGHDGPLPVVEVELGLDVLQVEAGLVVGLDGADVAPVGQLLLQEAAGDAVLGEIVGVDDPGADKRRQDVGAEVVGGGWIGGVGDRKSTRLHYNHRHLSYFPFF